jgi:quercetin dioxygenase-like cupin family protein
MPLNRKEIHDFIADTEMVGSPPPSPTGFERKTIWSTAESSDLIEAEVYSFEPGRSSDAHHHPDHVELVICWRGRGTMSIAPLKADSTPSAPAWDTPFQDVTIAAGDTFIIPKGASHRFQSVGPLQNPEPKDRDKLVEKLVLIVVHAINGVAVKELPGKLEGLPAKPYPASLKRNYRDEKYFKFDRNHKNRAIRARIWGRDADAESGAADTAKESLHCTLYTFVPGQENPGHFHPHSVELVFCLQGRARMSTKPKNPGTGWGNEVVGTIREGDSVLVAEADWHRYITSGNDDCLLLAMQTPHPIMHTLEHETNA